MSILGADVASLFYSTQFFILVRQTFMVPYWFFSLLQYVLSKLIWNYYNSIFFDVNSNIASLVVLPDEVIVEIVVSIEKEFVEVSKKNIPRQILAIPMSSLDILEPQILWLLSNLYPWGIGIFSFPSRQCITLCNVHKWPWGRI